MQSTDSSLRYIFEWYAAEYMIVMRTQYHWSKQRQIIILSRHWSTRMWLIEVLNLNINPRMKKTTFIIVFSLAMQVIPVKQIRKNEVWNSWVKIVINPLDLILTKMSEWCLPVKIPENPKGDETEGVKITVIQKFGSQNVKGIKCSKRVSKFRLYCGTYGHQKFFGPPSILEPEIISESECSDMYARKAYIINGKTMRIGLNQQIQSQKLHMGRSPMMSLMFIVRAPKLLLMANNMNEC